MADIPPDLDEEDFSSDEALFEKLGTNTPEHRAAVEAGLASLNAGRSIAWEDVRRWVQSWGTKNELPPPECP